MNRIPKLLIWKRSTIFANGSTTLCQTVTIHTPRASPKGDILTWGRVTPVPVINNHVRETSAAVEPGSGMLSL